MQTYLRKFILLAGILTGFYLNGKAQVNLTATGGTLNASYTTLGAAFTEINNGTHTGVITISITGNITETATASINASGSGSASYTSVTITPTVPVTISGSIAGAIIKLNGADNVTIDGRIGGTGRNITIQNTNTSTGSAGVWISSAGVGAGSKLNVLRNCEIMCGVTQNTAATVTYAVIMTGATISSTTGGADNDSNQFLENRITRARYGFLCRGESATNLNEGNTFSNNIIGPTSGGVDQIGKVGIWAHFENNATISYNTIQFVGGVLGNTSAGADRSGIALGGESWAASPTVGTGTNFKIHHNVIHDIIDERTFSAIGIMHLAGNSGSPTNHKIYNNFIYNVHSNGTSGDQGVGIGIAAGNNDIVAFNSISMAEGDIDPTGATTATGSNCGIRIASATPVDLTLKNNVINVDLSSNTATLNHYCIIAPSGTYSWGAGGLNNNDYWINSSNAQMKIGGTGTAVPYTPFATFANWKTNFSATQDLNSQNVVPNFTSSTNLHIVSGLLSNLESKATVIAGINNDIDNDLRPGPAGSVNGGALAPDIGADEFDGIPSLIDVGVTQLLSPQSSGCHGSADTVKIRFQNFSIQAIDFSLNPVTINTSVTGANPVVFTPLVLNTGTLASMAFLDTVISTSYNMTATGNYTFHSRSTVMDDGNTSNDSIVPVSINLSGGTVSSGASTTCALSPVTLTVSGYTNGGSVQWQYFSPNTLSWTNYPGGNVTPFSTLLTDSTDHFRALICGNYASNVDSVDVITVQEPVAGDVTRCGAGPVSLSATGMGLRWYNQPVGGTLLDTGNTFVTNVTSSTNFYVEATSGQISGQLNCMPLAGGNGCGGGVMFAVTPTANLDITGFIANLGSTAGSSVAVGIYYKTGTYVGSETNSGAWTFHQTVNVTAAGPNNGTSIPINSLSLNGGQQYAIYLNADMDYTDVAGPTNFSNADMTVQVGSGLCSLFGGNNANRGFNGSVIYGGGCSSTRDTVSVIVTPSDTIVASAATNPVCSNQTSVLSVSSTNANYQYTWSPSAGLSGTTGTSVTTSSDTTITYTITALDNSTQCAAYTNITVTVNEAPSVTITTPDTAICANTNLQFGAGVNSHIISTATVGFGTSTNTATSTTILGPYGGLYGGARHQYLITAAELSGSGISAGNLDQLAFEVTALNSVPALADYTIKMGTTPLTALTLSFTPGLQTVYYNASYTPVLGWNTHDITPFYWDGTSNILVEVCFNNQNAGASSGNASVRYTTTSGSVVYYRADNDPNVCGMLSGSTGSSRPNIRFYRNSPLGYQWTPATGLSNTAIADPVLTAISSNTYTLTVTDSVNGCTASDNAMITVNPLPVFTIGNDTLVCENSPVTPFAIYGSDINLSYVWFDNTSGSGTVVNGPGVYYATGTNAGGCSSSDTMVVGTTPPADVDINVDIISSNMAELDAGSGFTSYAWSNSQTTQVATVTGNGTYWVQVVDANGCANADTISIIFSLGLSNPDGSIGELLFYPNPSSGIVNMAGSNISADDLKLDIMDMNGRIVYTRNIQQPGENFLQQLDLSGVAEGTYIIRVMTGQSVYSNRIIIARQ